MSLRIVVEPEADADVAVAQAWYRARSRIASARFSQAFKDALRLIGQNPYQYQIQFGRYRRALLRPFPYAMIYTVTETEIVVVACVHTHRHPKRWQDRIPE
jgi:toxin ParE1/3/4